MSDGCADPCAADACAADTDAAIATAADDARAADTRADACTDAVLLDMSRPARLHHAWVAAVVQLLRCKLWRLSARLHHAQQFLHQCKSLRWTGRVHRRSTADAAAYSSAIYHNNYSRHYAYADAGGRNTRAADAVAADNAASDASADDARHVV